MDHFDLNAAINEVIVLARSAITENGISVQTGLADGLSPVQGDRVQVQQVVLNLVLNAVEAMGSVEAGPRELLISTEQDHTGVLVAVRDSGPGIDPTHLERVFEAFYTTKSSGKGMGLSVCRSIIDAHGGRLWANRTNLAVPYFSSPCPARKWDYECSSGGFTGRESSAKTPRQALFINWLAKVTDDAVVHGTGPVNVIGIGRHEDCRNWVPCFNKASVEFDPSHCRHMTSAIRQAVLARRGDARKSAADGKASTV